MDYFFPSKSSLTLMAYANVDYARCVDTWCSTTGCVCFWAVL